MQYVDIVPGVMLTASDVIDNSTLNAVNNCADYGTLTVSDYDALNWQLFNGYSSWPVYITTDKTAKAIEVLKILQREKLLDLKSVPMFIKTVEQIAKAL